MAWVFLGLGSQTPAEARKSPRQDVGVFLEIGLDRQNLAVFVHLRGDPKILRCGFDAIAVAVPHGDKLAV